MEVFVEGAAAVVDAVVVAAGSPFAAVEADEIGGRDCLMVLGGRRLDSSSPRMVPHRDEVQTSLCLEARSVALGHRC